MLLWLLLDIFAFFLGSIAAERNGICQCPFLLPISNGCGLNSKPSKRFKMKPCNNGSFGLNENVTMLLLKDKIIAEMSDGAFAEDLICGEKACAKFIKLIKPTNQNCWSRMCAGNVTEEEFENLFPLLDEKNKKYVLATFHLCGGLGNQMWRFASLYVIGKPYGRRPIFTMEQQCFKDAGKHEREGDDELKKLFPVFSTQLKYIELNPDETFELSGFAEGCCTYDDPERVKFSSFKQKYVKIDSYYLQSYKFFEGRRHEIRQIYQFSPKICAAAEAYRQKLFKNDTAHKICVHTRTGDFINFGYESRQDFTEKSIEFVHAKMKKSFGAASIVLMGQDKKFLSELKINREEIPIVYISKGMPRGNDLAFGTIACDSLIITAPSSTFSWWIGYLMPNNAPVFYSSDLDHTPYRRQNFLPEWTALKLGKDSKIRLD